MSTSDQIYLSTGLPVREVAQRLARELGLELQETDSGRQVFRRGDGGGVPDVGGEVDVNGDYVYQPEGQAPEEASVVDGYDVQWDLWSTDKDEDRLHAAGRALFDLVAERLPWPALFVVNFQRLVAASRPGEGVVEFPPHTSPDAPGRDVWAPFALPR